MTEKLPALRSWQEIGSGLSTNKGSCVQRKETESEKSKEHKCGRSLLRFAVSHSTGSWLLTGTLFFFFKLKIYLFIYLFIFGCVGSLLLLTGATLRCGAWASHCGGFSCCGARALGTWSSVVVAHGLSSCGSRALERVGSVVVARRLTSCGKRAGSVVVVCRLSSCGSRALECRLSSCGART